MFNFPEKTINFSFFGNFLIGLKILEYLIKEEKYKPNLKISFIHDINYALESVKFFDNDEFLVLDDNFVE